MGRPVTSGDLERALAASPTAKRAWEGLPSSHRREYLEYIDEAKKAETRTKRISRTVERLAEGH